MSRAKPDVPSDSQVGPWASLPFWLACGLYVVVVAYKLLDLTINDFERLIFTDQVIFEQAMRSFMHGKGLYAPFEAEVLKYIPKSHNASHYQPVLYLLAPIYMLHPGPFMIKLLEIAWVYGGFLPLFFLTRRILDSAWAGLVMVGLFVLDWPLWYQMHMDFHPINMAIPCYFWALWFVETRRPWLTLPWLFAALLTKETEVFTLAAFAVFLVLWDRRWWKPALATLGLTGAWYYWVFQVIFPYYSEGRGYFFAKLFAKETASLTDAFVGVFLDPTLVTQNVAQYHSHEYVAFTLGRTMFLPLLAPLVLVPAIPATAALLLSKYAFHKQLVRHYNSPTIPFLYVSVLYAVRRLGGWMADRLDLRREVVMVTLVGCFALPNVGITLTGYLFPQIKVSRPVISEEERRISREVAALVPEGAVVSTSSHFTRYLYLDHEEVFWFPFTDPIITHYLYRAYHHGDAWERHQLNIRMSEGYLPLSPHWREGYYFLGQNPPPEERTAFLAMLRHHGQEGYDFSNPMQPPIVDIFGGLGIREQDGAWIEHEFLSLPIAVEPGEHDYLLRFRALHPVDMIADQNLHIGVNAQRIVTLKPTTAVLDEAVRLPREQLHPGANILHFEADAYFSPFEMGLSTDARRLRLKMQRLSVVPVD